MPRMFASDEPSGEYWELSKLDVRKSFLWRSLEMDWRLGSFQKVRHKVGEEVDIDLYLESLGIVQKFRNIEEGGGRSE